MLAKISTEECAYGDVHQMEQCSGYCAGKILKNFCIQGDDNQWFEKYLQALGLQDAHFT